MPNESFIWNDITVSSCVVSKYSQVYPMGRGCGQVVVVKWLWSSGQRARLLLRRSEIESRWNLPFFCKIVFEKNEKTKKAGQRLENLGNFLIQHLVTLTEERSLI